MTSRAGELITFDPLVSYFVWRIPRMKSIIQQEDASQRLQCDYEFCCGVWTFKITGRDQFVFCEIDRQVKTDAHKNYLHCTLFTVKSDQKQYLLGQLNDIFDKQVNMSCFTSFSWAFSWDVQNEDYINLICWFKCFECNTALRKNPVNGKWLMMSSFIKFVFLSILFRKRVETLSPIVPVIATQHVVKDFPATDKYK